MFEEIIIKHRQKLAQSIGTNKRFVALSEILANNLVDETYKTYFNAEVNSWIYEEQIRRETNPLFDFRNDKIKLQLEEFDKTLFQIARFDRPTLTASIESAVTTRLNYLIRPRTTLKWFVFRGEPTKPYIEIIKRLSFFNGYDYLISGFVTYVNDNNLIASERDLLSVLEFTDIIEKIDNKVLYALQPEEFVDFLMPMVAFFNPDKPSVDKTTLFPIEALIIFLDDKGIEPLKNRLEELLLNKDIKEINGEMFIKEIYGLLTEIERDPDTYRKNFEENFGIEPPNVAEQSDTIDANDESKTNEVEMNISELEEILDDKIDDGSEDDLEAKIHEGYREMMELNKELAEISRTLNKMKSRVPETGNNKSKDDDKNKDDEKK